MLGYLEKLRPATIRVYAECLEHRRRTGSLPSAEVVETIAAAEGANPAACLALVLYVLRSVDGDICDLRRCGHCAVVRDVEVLHAILAHSETGPQATLKTSWGKIMHWRKLPSWAAAWETCEALEKSAG